MKILTLFLGLALSTFPTTAPLPMPDFNPAIRVRGSKLTLAWRWLKWAAWYPFDWLFHEEHYAYLIRARGVTDFKLIGAPNEPPASYRRMIYMIDTVMGHHLRPVLSDADLERPRRLPRKLA
jgi:hypothetical protein